jgi:hypothetical protein
LGETREKVEEEKREKQRKEADEAKREADEAKREADMERRERDRLQALFDNIPREEDTNEPETTAPKKDVNETIFSEEQLKLVEGFFKGKILIKEVAPAKYSIEFPMYKIEGELYKIYLLSKDGMFYLSDEGTTYAELDKIFELNEPDVIKNLLKILKQYGCRKKDTSFVIDCTLEDIHIKASRLIQAISFMLNMKIFYV